MTNRLEPIVAQKKREVAALRVLLADQPEHALAHLLQGKTRHANAKRFARALRGPTLGVIAEIKRKSPSKGTLALISDPPSLAQAYVAGGAHAISVLTDEPFFAGNLTDLKQVATALRGQPTPVLRKDFIIDEIQIAESILAGADAILCIVAILGSKTKQILDAAHRMGLEALVEVHSQNELDIALASGAQIIGINNRDLTTFAIDTEQAIRLIDSIPPSIIRVAESGILMPELAQTYYHAGFDAVLIGEALVTSNKPGAFIGACKHA
ncbi:MAG TPA: indole-3-glycerol phosphate synthase TrpC [Legionella sp.]|nr:indole-3-glycerol phosphate synthase TrpC [Legionella sp.]